MTPARRARRLRRSRHPIRRWQERKAVREAVALGSTYFLYQPGLPPGRVREELYATARRAGAQISLKALPPRRYAPLAHSPYRAYRVFYWGPPEVT